MRSGEARGARWDEIDIKARTWSIPADRMKAGVEHRIPLSDASLDVLRRALALDNNSGLVFPSHYKHGRGLSDMTLTKVLRDTGLAKQATVPRIPNVVQDLVHGDDGHPLGRGRGGPGAHSGQFDRTGIRPLRPVRAAARSHGRVGRLRPGRVKMPLPEDFENGVQGMLDYETARTKAERHGAPPPKLADFLKDGAQDMLDADQDDPLRPLPPSKSLTVRGPGPAKITTRTMLQAIERDRKKVTEAATRRRLATLIPS